MIGVIKGDTRSLDCGSYESVSGDCGALSVLGSTTKALPT